MPSITFPPGPYKVTGFDFQFTAPTPHLLGLANHAKTAKVDRSVDRLVAIVSRGSKMRRFEDVRGEWDEEDSFQII